ncbi:MAG TPA: PAS domain S-box protein [Terriglobales bacterium]|nr:PAS domain S-box protein [Terriglobales bacterium]
MRARYPASAAQEITTVTDLVRQEFGRDGTAGHDLEKYKALFEGAGVAIFDCDFSAIHARLEEVRQATPDVRRYLLAHPELIRECIAKIVVRDLNEHAVTLYGAKSKEELKARLSELFPVEAEHVFAEEFLALYEGKLHFQEHKTVRTFDGEQRCVLVTVTAVQAERPMENVIVTVLDVTAHDRAREALKESEARFRDIFELNVIAMDLYDAGGRVVQANQAFLAMTGYTREEVEAGLLQCEMLVSAEDWPAVAEAKSGALEKGRFTPLLKDIIGRDGSRIPVLLSGGSLAGRSDLGVTFLFDLREQKRAADAVRRKTAYTRLLRDVSAAAKAPSEPREVLAFCLEMLCNELDLPLGHAFLVENDRAISSQIWHCPQAEVSRYAEFMVATAEMSSAGSAGLMRAARASELAIWQWEEKQDGERCGRARAAQKCGIQSTIILPLFVQGEPVAILELASKTKLTQDDEELTKILVAFSTELSRVFERRQSREALQKRDEHYRALMKNFPGGYVIVFDRSLHCVLADGNQLRKSAEPLAGKSLAEVIQGNFGPGFITACLDALEGKPGSLEMLLHDGRTHHVEVAPIGSDGELGMIISHDISVLKRSERALRESESRLRDYAERLLVMARRLIKAHEEERTRIARELHDDFNQRIAAACISLSNLLQDSKLKDPQIRSEVVKVKEMISDLSHDIRSMSHNLHPAVLEHVGVTAALRAQCEEFGRLHKIGLEFECQGHDTLDRVDSETSICLYRVLQEALTNVKKHSEARHVLVRVHADTEQVQMRVHDDGRSFDPVQARSAGLGLTNMEERVKMLSGRFMVTSDPGQGNDITVVIPVLSNRLTETGERQNA